MTEHLVFVVWTISIVVVAILAKMRFDALLMRRIEEELDLLADLLNERRESENENDDAELSS